MVAPLSLCVCVQWHLKTAVVLKTAAETVFPVHVCLEVGRWQEGKKPISLAGLRLQSLK